MGAALECKVGRGGGGGGRAGGGKACCVYLSVFFEPDSHRLSPGNRNSAASGGGGGRFGDGGKVLLSTISIMGGGGGSGVSGGVGEDGKTMVAFLIVCCAESDVFDEREVDDEEIETDEIREDLLSGTLGFTLFFPVPGDILLKSSGTGVRLVGVFDWLEYPLEGEVTLQGFSGDVLIGLDTPLCICCSEKCDDFLGECNVDFGCSSM